MDIDWQDFAGKAIAFLTVSTLAVPIVRAALVKLRDKLKGNGVSWDDGIVAKAIVAVDAVAGLLAFIADLIPIVSIGRAGKPPVPRTPLLCLALVLAGAGCHGGGEVRDARMARTDYILGAVESALLVTGQVLVPHYEAAEKRCADGPVGEYVDCTDPWNKAVDALSAAYYSTRSARDGLDAGRGAPVLPCIAGMVGSAIQAVNALDLDIPEAVTSGLNAAQSLAGLLGSNCEVEP